MKAVILAAGQGTRIRAVHGEHPKCLIEVDDKTILDHQIEGSPHLTQRIHAVKDAASTQTVLGGLVT